LDLETKESMRKKLLHATGEAEQFYRSLQGERVRVGIESSGNTRGLERLLSELGYVLGRGPGASASLVTILAAPGAARIDT
jgi:hypothetical protein